MMETTEASPLNAEQKGTNTPLLGGLLFLTLFLVFVVITVLIIFFCYCRKAKGERYKYNANSAEEGRRREVKKEQNVRRENPADNFITTRSHSSGVSTTGMLTVEGLRRISERYENGCGESGLHGARYDISYTKHFASKNRNDDARRNNGSRPEEVSRPKPQSGVRVAGDKTAPPGDCYGEQRRGGRVVVVANRVYTPPELRKLPPVPEPERRISGSSTDTYSDPTSGADRAGSPDSSLFRKTGVRRKRNPLEDDLVYDSNIVYESTDANAERNSDPGQEVKDAPEIRKGRADGLDYHDTGERSRLPEVEALHELDKAVEGHLDPPLPIRIDRRLPPLEGGKLPPIGGARGRAAAAAPPVTIQNAGREVAPVAAVTRVRRHSVSGIRRDDNATSSSDGSRLSPTDFRRMQKSASFRESRTSSGQTPASIPSFRRSHSTDGMTSSTSGSAHASVGRHTPVGVEQIVDSARARADDGERARSRSKTRPEAGRARDASRARSDDDRRARDASRTRSTERYRERDLSKTRSNERERDASRSRSEDERRARDASRSRSEDDRRARDASRSRSEDDRRARGRSKTRSEAGPARDASRTRSGGRERDSSRSRPSAERERDSGKQRPGDGGDDDDDDDDENNNDEQVKGRRHHHQDHHHSGDERKRHHHHNKEHGNHGNRRKEKCKQGQLDDLVMTLHAEDELYQMHKRAPPSDVFVEYEQEYSV